MGERFGVLICKRVTRRRTLSFGAAVLSAAILAARIGRAEQPAAAPERVVKIAPPGFIADSNDVTDIARETTQIVTDDLNSSDHFVLIESSAVSDVAIDAVPQFSAWRSLGAEALIVGRVAKMADGRLRSEFRLWDVAGGQALLGAQYFSRPEKWRQVGHVISGTVHERLIGEKRDFEPHSD